MRENLNIVQLRSTIFLRQDIVYTPKNAASFKELLLPGGQEYGLPFGTTVIEANKVTPQYGMPWRLTKKSDGGEYNIVFQTGKIDMVLNKDMPYNDVEETRFCSESMEKIAKIMDRFGPDCSATRVAYAPLYAVFKENESSNDMIWPGLLRNIEINGAIMRDINLAFVLKSSLNINSEDVQINLFHNIFDGMRRDNDSKTSQGVIMFQLDLNTTPEKFLRLDVRGLNDFFNGVLNVKNELLDKFLSNGMDR